MGIYDGMEFLSYHLKRMVLLTDHGTPQCSVCDARRRSRCCHARCCHARRYAALENCLISARGLVGNWSMDPYPPVDGSGVLLWFVLLFVLRLLCVLCCVVVVCVCCLFCVCFVCVVLCFVCVVVFVVLCCCGLCFHVFRLCLSLSLSLSVSLALSATGAHRASMHSVILLATREKAIRWQVHRSVSNQSATIKIRPPLQKAWRCVRSGSPPPWRPCGHGCPKGCNLEISDYSQMTPKCPTDCLKVAPRWHQRQHDQAGPPRTSAERPERHRATCPKYP